MTVNDLSRILRSVEQKAEVQAFLVCDQVAREPTGKVHVRGVFDEILCGAFPAAHASMALYFRIRLGRASEQVQVSYSFRAPSGLEQQTPSIPMRIGPKGVLEGATIIQGFELPKAGQYEIKLFIDGHSVATYEFSAAPITIMPGAGNVGSAPN